MSHSLNLVAHTVVKIIREVTSVGVILVMPLGTIDTAVTVKFCTFSFDYCYMLAAINERHVSEISNVMAFIALLNITILQYSL